jgi:hypothetical protein
VLPATGKSYAVLGAIAVGYALTAVGYAVLTRSDTGAARRAEAPG